MILLDGILVGLLLALAARGRIAGLARVHIRFEALFFICLAIQLIAPRALGSTIDHNVILFVGWVIPSGICVVISLMNWRVPGMKLIALGLLMNLAVVIANGGMPVMAAAAAYAGSASTTVSQAIDSSWLHVPVTSSVRLAVLADVIPVPGPSFHRGLISLGDVMMSAGAGQLIFLAMTRSHN